VPAKPFPETVTVEPTEPLLGLEVIEGVTVNVADPEFELESATTTGWPPAVEAGTVNVTSDGILPDPSVVVVPLKATGEPAKLAENVELTAKPLPKTVTVEPTGPLFRLKEMEGVRALACILVNAKIDNEIRNAIIRVSSFFIFLSF